VRIRFMRLLSLSFQWWQIQGVCMATIFPLECNIGMTRRCCHFFLCFYSWWLIRTWIWMKVNFLIFFFFRSFNLWMSFTISSSHFPLWCNLCCLLNCLCSKNDELKVKYCHITCHFLFAVFHIVIILGDLLILPLLSLFFFLLWILLLQLLMCPSLTHYVFLGTSQVMLVVIT